MPKKKQTQKIEEFRHADINAFRRSQWFETAKTVIQIILMGALALTLCVFLVLIIVAGTSHYLPETEGTKALMQLFIEISSNAKAVGLFALGFFFREYLNSNRQGN